MESRFGHDFSQVRIHTDERAARSARAIHALAYTVRQEIYFGSGQFGSETQESRHLLAHELAHVVQQRTGVARGHVLGGSGGLHERQADAAANAVAHGRPVPAWLSRALRGSAGPAPAVQRKEAPDTSKVSEPTREPVLDSPDEVQDGPTCDFKMNVNDVVYCFQARADSKKPNVYILRASPLLPKNGSGKKGKKKETGAQPPLYAAYNVGVSIVNGKRVLTSADSIVMKRIDDLTGEDRFEVDPHQIAVEWNASSPVTAEQETGGVAWDFVVLEVRDDIGKTHPRQIVFWMGDPRAGPPKQPGKKIATFQVGRSELNALLGGVDYYKMLSDLKGKEFLTPELVRKLIAGKEPRQTSEAGFDTTTYVGTYVKAPTTPIQADGGEAKVPFDEGAGHLSPSGESYRLSMHIHEPPRTIQANFMNDASAIPNGLMAEALESFKGQVRLLLLYLQDTPEVDIRIYGDTDATGSPEENLKLSEKRAQNAKKYLTDKAVWTGNPSALDASRVTAEGRAEEFALKDLMAKHPNTWKSMAWTKAAENANFRRFAIEYRTR